MLFTQRKSNYVIQIANILASVALASENFGYTKREQHLWNKKFKTCNGKMQSPISISSSKSVAISLPALEMINYRNPLPSPLILKNNGHSAVVSINSYEKRRVPYIFGAVLGSNKEYVMDHFHFHWGAKNNRGSEHILNGIRFPMEMHIVHRNRAYLNLTNALNYQDGLVVLAIFFQLQEEDNASLYPILNNLSAVQWPNTEIKLNVSLPLASLLPYDTDVFYTYKGSLTTPPCCEVVTWIIFSKPVSISFKQINKFRTLLNGEDTLADNYRRLQEIGLRKVYRRLSPSLSMKYNSTVYNVTNLSWFWQ